jgi:DNA-binding NtrC family response regulator
MVTPRQPRILVIDDQPHILTVYSRALKRAGYDAQVAVSAEAALAAVRSAPPDAMLVDLNMPYINGMGLLYRVRETYPDMPVALITGNGNLDDHTLREVQALRAALHVKPLSITELLDVAEDLVGASYASRIERAC